jgi:hypothetical protein
VFIAILGLHVLAAITALVSGAVAMFSRKGPGRHPRSGHWYLWSLLVVFATACLLATYRWPGDGVLVILGGIALGAALYGFLFRRRHRPGDTPHIVAMGVSYIAMLTAFYVDNGPHLPIWNLLPLWDFWVLPALVGIPLILWAVWRRTRHTRAGN